MSNHFKRAVSGDSMAIPAKAWNAMLDIVEGSQRGQRVLDEPAILRTLRNQAGIILVKNTNAGYDYDRFDVVGLGDPVIDPDDNDVSFKNQAAVAGEIPVVATHSGRWAILLEPIAAGKIGRAVASGITIARVHYQGFSKHPRCDIWALPGQHSGASATTLKSQHHGAGEILWIEDPDTSGEQWAVIRIGNHVPFGTLFQVDLTEDGGSQGVTGVTDCSLVYEVQDVSTGAGLHYGSPIGPIGGRIPKTQYKPATRGMAFYEMDPAGNGGDGQVYLRLARADEEADLATMRWFIVVSESDDYYTCHPFAWPDVIDDDNDVLVAKVPDLRRSRWDGQTVDGVEYTYTANDQREASDGAVTDPVIEEQAVTPSVVFSGDLQTIILATRIHGGTGVSVGGVPIQWQHLNERAGAFAKLPPEA